MSPLLERFLRYVKINTQSQEGTGQSPSTPGQRSLADMLAAELREMGAARVRVTEYGIVLAELPALPECEKAPVLGFIAHLDTSDAASGKDVSPQIVAYHGGTVPLGTSGRSITPTGCEGKTLIVTDGTTLLGADDKAGVAEIMTCADTLLHGNVPHGKVCIAFTPDEEIGEGTRHFDLAEFGADYAYTADGGRAGGIEYQNFNAAASTVRFSGVSTHPGGAKDTMRNAQHLAMQFHAALPETETPEHTAGLQGFYHLTHSSGEVGSAELHYILRDFEAAGLERRKHKLQTTAEAMNRQYGANTVTVELRDQYRNMAEIIRQYPFLIEIAKAAAADAGLKPFESLIRGGTDGARLSCAGLPCPNLGTGGYNYHGECEYAVLEEMEAAARMLVQIAVRFVGARHVPAGPAGRRMNL